MGKPTFPRMDKTPSTHHSLLVSEMAQVMLILFRCVLCTNATLVPEICPAIMQTAAQMIAPVGKMLKDATATVMLAKET